MFCFVFFPGQVSTFLPNFLCIQFLSKSSYVILLLQTYLASFLEMRFADGEIFIKIFKLEINQRGFKTMMGKKQMKKGVLK